jgi:hypothetical protein
VKYIWELVVQAKQLGVSKEKINFTYPQRFSPYMEMSFEHLNEVDFISEVEVNPYYRFLEVFKGYYHPDNLDDLEIRGILFDLIVHYLAELDSHMGLTKVEYHINFVIRDIERGIFGDLVREQFKTCSLLEKKQVANNVLRFYITGEGIYLFQDSIKKLFEKATIFANINDKDMLLVHLAVPETKEREQKVQLLKTIFLPFKYEIRIYWEHLFGVIGVPGLMKQGEILMYED